MTGEPDPGRALPSASPFAGDDGTAPPALAAALALTGGARLEAVVEALRTDRVLVPVVAQVDEMGEPGEHGVAGEKSAHAAMVTVAVPDGRAALPVFSSVAALTAWRREARPVPVEGRRAALGAGADADGLLVLDPAGVVPVLLPRPAVRAIALGESWLPAVRHPGVLASVRAAGARSASVRSAVVEPGAATEITVVLELAPGLTRAQVAEVVAGVQHELAGSAVIADAVDSLTIRIRSGDR